MVTSPMCFCKRQESWDHRSLCQSSRMLLRLGNERHGQIPCKEVLRSHPVKLQRYNTLGSIKASCKNAAQLSQERLHVPPVAKLERQDYQRWSPDKPTRAPGAGRAVAAFVGCLFVCLFVLMSLVLLCTSQNGDLQVQ